MCRIFGFVILLSLNTFSGFLSAQIVEIPKWEVLDLSLIAPPALSDPFAHELSGVFTHSSGKTVEIQGFYNGDSNWIVRASFSEVGAWSYQIFSDIPELSDQRGTITVLDPLPQQRGPILVDPNQSRRFIYADGTPYFLLAFELDWLFALDTDNTNELPRTRELVSEVKKNGFNQIVMNVFAYDANWGERDQINPEHDFSKPKIFPFGGTNNEPDFSTLNINFFKHLDAVITHLNEQEIVAHLMIYVWNKQVAWPEPESVADNRYFDYVIKRYQAYPNVLWDISKEALAYGRDDLGYITRRIDRLRKLDAHQRLVTVHDYNYCRQFPEKVDFISVQEWMPNLHNEMLRIAENHPNKPVFNIENGCYEQTTYSIFQGAYSSPEVCLRRTYETIFAGVYATYYWQNTAWYNVIWNPTSLPISQQPRFIYYRILKELFDEFDFNTLTPVQDSFTPLGLTNSFGQYLYFVPADRLGLFGELAAMENKEVSIQWVDVQTGLRTDSETFSQWGGRWLGFYKPEEIAGHMAVAILTLQ